MKLPGPENVWGTNSRKVPPDLWRWVGLWIEGALAQWELVAWVSEAL